MSSKFCWKKWSSCMFQVLFSRRSVVPHRAKLHVHLHLRLQGHLARYPADPQPWEGTLSVVDGSQPYRYTKSPDFQISNTVLHKWCVAIYN